MGIPKDVQAAINLVNGLMTIHPQGIAVRDAWETVHVYIAAQDAEITRHAEMVAKLRDILQRIRPNVEAAPWLIAEISQALEAEPAELTTLSDFVNLPDAERKVIGQQVAAAVDVAVNNPVQVVDVWALVESIAVEWDGCEYEAVGEIIDIGAEIRAKAHAIAAEPVRVGVIGDGRLDKSMLSAAIAAIGDTK